ncbi:MAG TPA: sulfotransferase [Azospirillaceae bacterium]|nr:sulfotransferase [Azospirillaceae bacterium]
MSGTSYAQEEHGRRLSGYRVEDEVHASLTRMNELLAAGEQAEPSGIDRPNLFIFGLPRSGTTLLYQLLAHALDIGYVSNLAARFWLAPRAGLMLARSVLGNRRDGSFQSDYGKSLDPSGPHEFSYFWQHRLGIRDEADMLRFGDPGEMVDWRSLRSILGTMQDVFDRGLVHKTNYAANVAPGIARHLQMPLFIRIERHPLAVALSILKARHAYYGSSGTWWATHPPTFAEIKDLPFDRQIARQVVDLGEVYRRVTSALDPDMVLSVTYDELCRDPARLVAAVRERVRRVHGAEIGILNPPPARFREVPPPVPRTEEERAVAAALASLQETSA